jgi:hypothetical protein
MAMKKPIKIFMVHQFLMSELQAQLAKRLQSYPHRLFVDMSCPIEMKIPIDKLEYIQEIACGRMMESDLVIVLPDMPAESQVEDRASDSISVLGDTFTEARGLHHNSTYATEIRTLMFDSCDSKPALVLGWTKESAEYLADKLRHPHGIGSRAYDSTRFHAMGLDEASGRHDIAKKILSILDEQS